MFIFLMFLFQSLCQGHVVEVCQMTAAPDPATESDTFYRYGCCQKIIEAKGKRELCEVILDTPLSLAPYPYISAQVS